MILANTDPKLVYLQLDTYWMYRGGQDPIEWMDRSSNRVILLHQKDSSRTRLRNLLISSMAWCHRPRRSTR